MTVIELQEMLHFIKNYMEHMSIPPLGLVRLIGLVGV